MYAVIYYKEGMLVPYPCVNSDGSLKIFNAIEDADNYAESIENDDQDAVTISIDSVAE